MGGKGERSVVLSLPITLIGLGIAGTHLYHVERMAYRSTLDFVLLDGIPALVAVTLFPLSSYLLARKGAPVVRRVVVWTAAGALLGLRSIGTIYWHQLIHGLPLIHWYNAAALLVQIGAIAGGGLGLNFARLAENRRERETYRRAVESSDDPMILTDTEPAIVDVNEAFTELFGYELGQVEGEPPSVVGSEETGDRVYREMWEALERGEPWAGEIIDVGKEGSKHYLRLSISPVERDGELMGFAGSYTDLTERERYEESLKVLLRVLRHDLRNSLNFVQGNIAMAREEGGVDGYLAEAQEEIERLLTEADRARDLKELLECHELDRVDVVEVVRGVVESIREEHPEANLTYSAPCQATALSVGYLDQAVRELVENALIHNDREDPEVEVEVLDLGDEVSISVRDNGPGIEEELREHLFGDGEDGPLKHGQGMGLFLVNQIVDLSGGRIELEGNEPRGATFRMFLNTE